MVIYGWSTWIYIVNIVIFHNYVSLPEGRFWSIEPGIYIASSSLFLYPQVDETRKV